MSCIANDKTARGDILPFEMKEDVSSIYVKTQWYFVSSKLYAYNEQQHISREDA